jgi:hypothetical protein
LQVIRDRQKLKDAAKLVLQTFGYASVSGFVDVYLDRLTLQQTEELIRQLKAILDS